MTAMVELTLALLAAVGLLCLGWVLFGKLLTPVGKLGAPMYILVRGEGNGVGLEHTVNTLVWLRGRNLTDCPLLLVDAGLNEEGRRMAGLLLNRWPEIRLCRPEDVANYVI